MSFVLSNATQKLIEDRMRARGFATPDDVVRVALAALDEVTGEDIEQLDAETQAAIGRAEAQSAHGEGRPWEEVRAQILAKYPPK